VAGPVAARIPLVSQIAVVVVGYTVTLLSPNVVRVGVETALLLRTCTHNARVKFVRAPAAVGYLTVYTILAACVGT